MTSRPAPGRQVAAACFLVLGLPGCEGMGFGGSHYLRPELEQMLAATVYPRGTEVELHYERVQESFLGNTGILAANRTYRTRDLPNRVAAHYRSLARQRGWDAGNTSHDTRLYIYLNTAGTTSAIGTLGGMQIDIDPDFRVDPQPTPAATSTASPTPDTTRLIRQRFWLY